MAQIVLNIPDEQLSRVVEALCARHGYEDIFVEEGVSPPSKGSFAQGVVVDLLNRSVREHEEEVARRSAELAVSPVTGMEFEK